MARDCAALERVKLGDGPFLRLYTWNGPWVSLGRFQHPERELGANCPAPWVMRPTGGKAVLHGHDQTIALAFNLAHLGEQGRGMGRQVRSIYNLVVRPLVGALNCQGVEVSLAEDLELDWRRARVANCFQHVAQCDIVEPRTMAKRCGCALRVEGNFVLLHASIPYRQPLIPYENVFDEVATDSLNWDPTGFSEALKEEYAKLFGA